MEQPKKFTGNELKYLNEFIDNPKTPFTMRFERAFSSRFGVRYAIAHNSGTSTLHSCLAAAGVGPGDEVISPAITVIMNTFVTLYQNAVPVYADINPETFNIDPGDVSKKITKRTKAIMPVSLYGLPCDIDPLMEIAKEYGIMVIEDNAQCVLGMYKGKIAGTVAHMASFSLERTKHLGIGEGGIVITNDEKLAEKVRKTGGLGYKNLTAEAGRMQATPSTFQNPDYKRHDTLGWNYRMSEVVAALALAQVDKIDILVQRRQAIAKLFDEAIEGCKWMIPQKTPPGLVNSYYTYAVRFEGKDALGISWKQFYEAYIKAGGDGFYAAWNVPYLEPVMTKLEFYGKDCPLGCQLYGKKPVYKKGLCPIAESIQPKVMQFKTNYRDMELAKRKTEALKKTIKLFGA